MDIIVCLDDKGGMLFNHRRQSRDRLLVEDVLRRSAGRRLLISGFSAALFPDGAAVVVPDGGLLTAAQPGDICFVEDQSLRDVEPHIGQLTVYRWNRVYPADFYCDIDLTGWRLIAAVDFTGSSHEKITREVYAR